MYVERARVCDARPIVPVRLGQTHPELGIGAGRAAANQTLTAQRPSMYMPDIVREMRLKISIHLLVVLVLLSAPQLVIDAMHGQ